MNSFHSGCSTANSFSFLAFVGHRPYLIGSRRAGESCEVRFPPAASAKPGGHVSGSAVIVLGSNVAVGAVVAVGGSVGGGGVSVGAATVAVAISVGGTVGAATCAAGAHAEINKIARSAKRLILALLRLGPHYLTRRILHSAAGLPRAGWIGRLKGRRARAFPLERIKHLEIEPMGSQLQPSDAA